MKITMNPTHKVWGVINEILNLIDLSPKGKPITLECTKLEKCSTINEISLILEKFEQDEKIIKILTRPGEDTLSKDGIGIIQQNFIIQPIDIDKLNKLYDKISFKHIGSLELMHGDDFLALAEVISDIFHELGTTHLNTIKIPLRRDVVSHKRLLPALSSNMLDRYCNLRIKAIKYMLSHNHIEKFEFIKDSSVRWDDILKISINRRNFTTFYMDVHNIYKKKVFYEKEENNPQVDSQENEEISKPDLQPITINNNITNNTSDINETKQSKNKDGQTGLCPHLKWEDISIEFLNRDDVQIKYGKQNKFTNYKEMGFSHKNKGEPVLQWKVLYDMAENANFIFVQNSLTKDLKSQDSDLCEKIKKYFGIYSIKPTEYIESEAGNGYISKIQLYTKNNKPKESLGKILV